LTTETVTRWSLEMLTGDGWRHVGSTNFEHREHMEAAYKSWQAAVARNEALEPIARSIVLPVRMVKRTCVITETVEVLGP